MFLLPLFIAIILMAEAVTVPPDQCWNFTVWISVCVVFVLSSSVLVLFVWIIYRRYSQGKVRTHTHTQTL